ncbi:hypothetical protein N867_00885 [Actinotalea fermentans ATCC 43279 = JCM 9966 = DSM 3133]|nr:hypothetical protein N867_00885 [Actinotalea fermentans ATCC 43279 = JCM 9966 = DSM 3133]
MTVGRLAARFGLSRSTLLYYDRIGVLRPSIRSAAGYRLYGPDDVRRLAQICEYRRVGLPLAAVRRLLDDADDVAAALAVRLAALDREARELQRQRRAILDYLDDAGTPPAARFVAVLEAVGVDDGQRDRWHAAFERADPAEHQELLEFLRLPDASIAQIRARARATAP